MNPQTLKPKFHLKAVTALAVCLGGSLAVAPSAHAESYAAFVKSLWEDAKAQGIKRSTFDAATRGLVADKRIDRLTKNQPEFARPIGRYITKRQQGPRVSPGLKLLPSLKGTMAGLDRRFGVDPTVVVAIWGMETVYGNYKGKSDIFQTLSTLAWKRYRGTFFKKEFIAAMKLMEVEGFGRGQFKGSWTGAIGQTQFLPTSYLEHAVDGDGDGRRDLWGSRPDALWSAANYLKNKGWVRGQPWGFPVRLPKGLTPHASTRPWQEWARAGVKPINGLTFPKSGTATLFFPAGVEGPAFLVTKNYSVIRSYNFADAYAVSVGLISDRFKGAPKLNLKWPEITPLLKSERIRMQKALEKKGYRVPNKIGRISHTMRMVIRDFQLEHGMVPDGHPDQAVLRRVLR
ncbi:MAG: lytic murein transglycosylase [Pseudomonadota bacterium]